MYHIFNKIPLIFGAIGIWSLIVLKIFKYPSMIRVLNILCSLVMLARLKRAHPPVLCITNTSSNRPSFVNLWTHSVTDSCVNLCSVAKIASSKTGQQRQPQSLPLSIAIYHKTMQQYKSFISLLCKQIYIFHNIFLPISLFMCSVPTITTIIVTKCSKRFFSRPSRSLLIFLKC